MGTDMLVAWDDQLTARMMTCTTCGRTPALRTAIWVSQRSPLAVAAAQCSRCVAADPQGTGLVDFMQHRYHQQWQG
jgi:hypothetical protein